MSWLATHIQEAEVKSNLTTEAEFLTIAPLVSCGEHVLNSFIGGQASFCEMKCVACMLKALLQIENHNNLSTRRVF